MLQPSSVTFKYYPAKSIPIKKQGDYMKRSIALIIITLFLLSTVFLIGCTKTETIYVCATGRETPDKDTCGTNKVAGVKKTEAETYASRYVSGYFSSYGGKSQLVSSYLDPEKGDYFATFIVAERDSEPYETVVSIDGVTGQVSCSEKCDYT